MNAAVFLDRDGTIIKDKGYINSVSDVEFYDFTFSSLRTLASYFKLFIVTNQAGIAQGLISFEQLEAIHNFILDKLRNEGIKIEKIYTCPHSAEDKCGCRKPEIKSVIDATKEFNIDLQRSYVIGDHLSDALLGVNSGARGIYVLTGHGMKHRKHITAETERRIIITKSLKFALEKIIKEIRKK